MKAFVWYDRPSFQIGPEIAKNRMTFNTLRQPTHGISFVLVPPTYETKRGTKQETVFWFGL